MLKIDRDILNNITVTIGGKPVQLRKTVHQIEQYGQWIAAKKSAPDGTFGNTAEMLKVNAEDSMMVCKIALNHDPAKAEFTEEQIANSLDVSEQDLLAKVWIDYKLMRPRLGPDPFLGPREGKPL